MITIIVPFKDSAKWIQRCCKSMKRQKGDFQFILVNDNSTDDGKQLAEEYTEGDQRFIIVDNQNAPGVSGARNTGLDMAEGEWITFLDADDELLKNVYNTFAAVLKTDANWHQLNHLRYYEKTKKLMMKSANEGGMYSVENPPISWWGVWNKLYHRDLVKDIRFDTDLQYGEDGLFNFECFAKCKVIHHAERNMAAVKHRFDNKNSLSHVKTAADIIKFIRRYEDFLMRQPDNDVRFMVVKELARLWSGPTFEKAFGTEYEIKRIED